jgi:hypothetical protein
VEVYCEGLWRYCGGSVRVSEVLWRYCGGTVRVCEVLWRYCEGTVEVLCGSVEVL